MEPLTHETLSLQPAVDSERKVHSIRWTGRSTARNPSQVLKPYFTALNEQAQSDGFGVEMDFRALEHFNSSTISALIQFLQDSRTRKVPLTLVYDAGVKWQRLSFEALRVFVKPDGLFTLRTV